MLPRAEIAALPRPSVGAVLVAAVGPWGGLFVAMALIVAVLGAYLSWTLLATEVLYSAACDHDLQRFLARTTTRSVSGPALLPATLLFRQARRERGEVVFTRAGLVILVVIVAGAIVAVTVFATSALTL